MKTATSLKLRKSILIGVVLYEIVFTGTYYAIHRLHPAGPVLVALAVMTTLPVILMYIFVGRYLREERDEYKRDLAVRCVLWGTAGAMSVQFFANFLRIFDWKGQLPLFTEFWVFALFMLVAKFSYRASNRVPVDA